MTTIGIICAVPQESGPVIRRMPRTTKSRLKGLRAWHFTLNGHRTTLLESGMGPANARRAADTLIQEIKPDLVISIGFCGALTSGLAVGDLVMAEQLYLLTETGLIRETFPKADCPGLSSSSSTGDCFHGSFITTETAITKESLRPILPGQPDCTVLEMETAFIARACQDAGIRFAALRSVSDSADEEPYHTFRTITVNHFDITAKSIITALMRQPGLILQLFRLGRNAARAGKTLAVQVQRILEQLP